MKRTATRREIAAAPPASRLYAYAIDWMLGGIVSGLPAVLTFAMLRHDGTMLGTLYDFEALGYPQWLGLGVAAACVTCALCYFVVVPWKVWPGQTPGKRVARLRVVSVDGTPATLAQLLVRQALGGFVLEGSGFVIARYLREAAVLITRVDVNYYWEIAGIVLTVVSAILAFALPARRALHDYLAATRVIVAEGHPLAD